MPNEFYTAPTDLIPLSTARSANENSDRDAVEAAFDKLPTEQRLKLSQVGADTGTTGGLYIVTTPYDLGSYVTGQKVKFEAAVANIGAASITVNGGANTPIKDMKGDDIVIGAIDAGQLVELTYTSGGVFQFNTSTLDANSSAIAAAASEDAAAASAAAALISEQNATSSALLFNEVANHFYRNS